MLTKKEKTKFLRKLFILSIAITHGQQSIHCQMYDYFRYYFWWGDAM